MKKWLFGLAAVVVVLLATGLFMVTEGTSCYPYGEVQQRDPEGAYDVGDLMEVHIYGDDGNGFIWSTVTPEPGTYCEDDLWDFDMQYDLTILYLTEGAEPPNHDSPHPGIIITKHSCETSTTGGGFCKIRKDSGAQSCGDGFYQGIYNDDGQGGCDCCCDCDADGECGDGDINFNGHCES